jgi:general stress protein YciG
MASSNQDGNQGSQGGKDPGGKEQSRTSNRGFASMDPDKQREIASKGGKAAHESGNAHEFTSEEAREAGRKGGQASGGGNQGGNQSGSGGNR